MPMNRYLSLFLLLSPLAADQTLTVTGRVRDENRLPVPGAAIELRARFARLTAVSDNEGVFSITGAPLAPGEIRVVKDGFEPLTLDLPTTGAPLDLLLRVSGVSTVLVVEDVAGKATGSRMDVPNIDLPIQVSSVSGTMIQLQGVNDMVNALRNVSGVSAQRWYGMYEYYTVRGFNIADVVLVDGMRLEGNRINTQLNNVEQVDVLKGPSSVLYGGQALSGAINILRKKPQGTRAYDFFYRVGRFRMQQVGGGLTGQVFGLSRLLYRIDGSFDYSEAWRGAGAKRLNISPTLTWLINDKNRVTVHQAFNRDRFLTDAGVPLGVINRSGFDLSSRFNTPQDFGLVRDSQTHVLYNANLSSAWEFRNGFFYRWTNDQYYSAETLTYRPALNQVDRQFLYFKHHRRPVLNQADTIGRFNFLGTRHTILAGWEYQDFYNFTHRSASRSVAIPPINLDTFEERYLPVPDFPISRVDYFTNRINAFFWQDQIAIAKRWKLNIGGRFDDFRRIARNDAWANNEPTARGPELRRNQQAYTYRGGIVYSLTESQDAYFSSSSSFQPVTQIPADGRELLPETGRSFEVGHRWRGFGGRLSASAALYHLVRNNVVVAKPNQEFDQAGQQSARGIDFDLNAALGWGVQAAANYGYALPRFDSFFIANGAVDLSGFRPRWVQRHAANVWLTKAWTSGVTASLGSRYISSMFANNTNTVRLGGYTVWGGAFGYRRGTLDWSVNAENLFGRQRYFVAGIYETQLYPGSPMNVFTTFRFRFQ